MIRIKQDVDYSDKVSGRTASVGLSVDELFTGWKVYLSNDTVRSFHIDDWDAACEYAEKFVKTGECRYGTE